MINPEEWTVTENPNPSMEHKNIALVAFDDVNLIVIDFDGPRLWELWNDGTLKDTFLDSDRPEKNGIFIWEGTTVWEDDQGFSYNSDGGYIYLSGKYRELTKQEWSDLEICGTEGPWDSNEYAGEAYKECHSI